MRIGVWVFLFGLGGWREGVEDFGNGKPREG